MMTARVPAGRILVGIDGSPAAAVALRWAAAEARFRGLRLHVVYVLDRRHSGPAPYAPPGHGGGLRVLPETALALAVRAALGPDLPPDWLLEVAEGAPAHVLLDRAQGAEMLVLGSSRPGSARTRQEAGPRAPLGPVARDCLRGAPCPVVVVRPGCAESVASPVTRQVSRDAARR
jgi:nucleotide-binding universal stress UspA family protein